MYCHYLPHALTSSETNNEDMATSKMSNFYKYKALNLQWYGKLPVILELLHWHWATCSTGS
jgi:hypothetical protein